MRLRSKCKLLHLYSVIKELTFKVKLIIYCIDLRAGARLIRSQYELERIGWKWLDRRLSLFIGGFALWARSIRYRTHGQ